MDGNNEVPTIVLVADQRLRSLGVLTAGDARYAATKLVRHGTRATDRCGMAGVRNISKLPGGACYEESPGKWKHRKVLYRNRHTITSLSKGTSYTQKDRAGISVARDMNRFMKPH